MPGDGDTIYGVSTATPNDTPGTPGAGSALFSSVIAEASDVYSRAITHAILAAENLGVAQTYCERYPGAKCPKQKDKAQSDTVVPVPAAPAGPTVGGGGIPLVPLALTALMAALLLGFAATTRPGRALVARAKP
jgi:hypothetical protein